MRRVAEVARLFADAGIHALVPVISPYRAGREQARAIHEAAGLLFVEVHMATSLDECERRDPKGLYARARRGELTRHDRHRRSLRGARAPRAHLRPGDASAAAASEIDAWVRDAPRRARLTPR